MRSTSYCISWGIAVQSVTINEAPKLLKNNTNSLDKRAKLSNNEGLCEEEK